VATMIDNNTNLHQVRRNGVHMTLDGEGRERMRWLLVLGKPLTRRRRLLRWLSAVVRERRR
jgi:hypothetical protein